VTLNDIDPFCVRLDARLDAIEYDADGELRVIISETTHLGPLVERRPREDPLDDTIEKLLSGARPIQTGPGDRTVQFSWKQPAAFVALDESFAGFEAPTEVPAKTVLHVLGDAAFRRYLNENLFRVDATIVRRISPHYFGSRS
jgi:hypothetical protein